MALVASPLSPLPAPLDAFPPFIHIALSQQTLCLNCRKTLIPKSNGNGDMFLEAFSKGQHSFSLTMYLSIQTDWQTNHQPLGLYLIDQLLDRRPGLRLIA